MKGVVVMINSPSLSPRQTLQGLSSGCFNIRKSLFELALIDTPLLASDHFIEAMSHLHKAALELSHLRVVASPDLLATITHDLPDLDPITNRL